MKNLLALLIPVALAAQVSPPSDSWPTYNGDYSGRRFSPLKQINQLNVKAMTLAWILHPAAGQNPPGTTVGGMGPSTSAASPGAKPVSAVCRSKPRR